MQITTHRPRVVAVLGPTNTGKTHLAMERMLAHESGMIGFPLRLLARENYERAVRAKGRGQVALITGEEKAIPPGARYFLCTVEAMPLDRRVAFLGVDEIQMCADPDRGHVFTQRLLRARGWAETMFMGAETVKPLLRALVPEVVFETRPRLSVLRHAGARKANRLPPRSAVVAFSAADVYALAEMIRRQRGGAAVVLGALSPRARNAQVGMYQAGEVDYLVATDAIGMGLNMDVDHVAFAATRKFDGRVPRDLTPSELAQIAGRAGRHMNDGTFGTTADVEPLDEETVLRIENHEFAPLRFIHWRNDALRFQSVAVLQRSLARPSGVPGLVRAREADDELVLHALSRDQEVMARAGTPDAVRLLWEVCQVPDFRKVMSDAHATLVARLYRHLMDDGRLPVDWVARQVAEIDRVDGDIETLVQRIANIRVWTYISYRGEWLADAPHWQERTRAVEDRLSDVLHERLAQRFVDRRTSLLVKRLKEDSELLAAVRSSGEVLVEGHEVGRLEGFRFAPDGATSGTAARVVAGAALKALRGEVARRLRLLEEAPDEAFTLDGDRVTWQGWAVARLVAGPETLRPGVEPLASELLEPRPRERLRHRLVDWLERLLAQRLGPLLKAREAPLTGAARGLVFQLSESLGSLPRHGARHEIDALGPAEHRQLRSLGIEVGRESLFMPALLKPAAVAVRVLLWAVKEGREVPAPPPPGRTSVPMRSELPGPFYEAAGFRPLGMMAVRVDMLERIAALATSLSRKGPFVPGPEMLSLAGCGASEMTSILVGLGFQAREQDGQTRFAPKARRKARRPGGARPSASDSPFARLAEMTKVTR